MSWLRTLISKLRRPHEPPAPSPGLREAEQARDLTERRLGTIKDQTPAILGVADQLIQLGVENDFAARLRNVFGGPPGEY